MRRGLLEICEGWEFGCDVLVYVGIGEKSVMVACYEEFVGMGLRFKPG